LNNNARKMSQIIENRPETPPDQLRIGHALQADVTVRMLGEGYAGTLRSWRDTYEAFSAAYADKNLRRSAKLARLNELFNALFIDRHPAYSLYRFWYSLVEQAPEFPAPPTNEPVPRLDENAATEPPEQFQTLVRQPGKDGAGKRRSRPLLLIGVLLIAVIAAVALIIGAGRGGDAAETTATGLDVALAAGTLGITLSPASPAPAETEADGASPTARPARSVTPAATLSLTRPPTLPAGGTAVVVANTLPPRSTGEPALAITATPTPTATRERTATPTVTASTTPTATNTPRPTLPPNGLQGEQALLDGPPEEVTAFLNDPAHFIPAQDPGQWRLGVGEGSGGELLVVAPSAADLNARYGAEAPQRVVRTGAELELITYNPPLLVDNDVYFGLLLQSVINPALTAGLQIDLASPGVLRLSQREGDTVTAVSQRTQGGPLDVRLERDLDAETVRILVNGQALGAPIPFVGGGEPVVPLLYVHDGGVIAHVADWSVTLR
jgi:hypothetical protein